MALLYGLLFLLLHSSLTGADMLVAQRCETDGGNFTANSTFQSNLNLLLTSLTSPNSTIFKLQTTGSGPNRAYGLAQCRGDVGPSNCSSCLQNAAQNLPQLCPYYKQATIWYDDCQLRYSNLRFFSTVDDTHKYALYNVNNATDWAVFNESMTELIETISNRAAYNSSAKFATGRMVYAKDSPAINGLVQCTRDVRADGCSRCLHDIVGFFLQCCSGKVGGRVFTDSCNFRYETYSFYQGKPTVSLMGMMAPSPSPLPASSSSLSPSQLSPHGSPPSSHLSPLSPPLALPPPTSDGKKRITGEVLVVFISMAIGFALTLSADVF